MFRIYRYPGRILIRIKKKISKIGQTLTTRNLDEAIFVRERGKNSHLLRYAPILCHYETVSKFRFGLSWSGRRWRAMQPATDIGGNGNSIWIGGTPVTSQVDEQQQLGQLRPERCDDRSGSGGWAANGTAERTHLRDGAGSWRKTMIIKLIPISRSIDPVARNFSFLWAENVTRLRNESILYLSSVMLKWRRNMAVRKSWNDDESSSLFFSFAFCRSCYRKLSRILQFLRISLMVSN